jgi:hypothetical protein
MITGVTELSVSVSVEDREGGSRTVVRLAGEADVTTRALAEVLGAEAAKKPRLLLVDLSPDSRSSTPPPSTRSCRPTGNSVRTVAG